MNSFYFDGLRKQLMKSAHLNVVTPSDCRLLSLKIRNTTGKYVSETTLKRFFGFANVKHNFSTFTLTTLSEYLGFNSWTDFKGALDKELSEKSSAWQDLRLKGLKLSEFTLRSIRNRSGIPYEITSRRHFAELDFHYFMKSGKSFTCFISPAGNGKSILVCHLAESFFLSKDALYRNAVLFFINASSLRDLPEQRTPHYLTAFLSAHLGISISDQGLFSDNKDEKTVIILDGIDEYQFATGHQDLLLDLIVDFINANEGNEQLKLALTMRPTSWLHFYERIRHSAYLKSQWHTGSYYAVDEVSNIPELNDRETLAVLKSIDPNLNTLEKVNPKLRSQLRFPFYLQMFYQNLQEGKPADYQKSLTFFELINEFVKQKIFYSKYSTEKLHLIKSLIKISDFGKKGYAIAKQDFLTDISAHKDAYDDLLHKGILVEDRYFGTDFQQNIRFSHAHLFEYFLSRELIEKYGGINDQSVKEICGKYSSQKLYLPVLEWIVRYIIMTGKLSVLKNILNLQLASAEKSYLTHFIAESLFYKTENKRKLLDEIRDSKLHETFLKKLDHFDYTDIYYQDTLETLLHLAEDDDDKYCYAAILACIAVIKLEKKELARHLATMERLNNTMIWPFAPAFCLRIIHDRINKQPEDKILLAEAQNFLKNPVFSIWDPQTIISPQGRIQIVSLLQLNALFGNFSDIVQIINQLLKCYPPFLVRRQSSFTVYILNIYGLAHLSMGDTETSKRIIKILGELAAKAPRENVFNNYLTGLLLAQKAILYKTEGNQGLFKKYAQKSAKIFEDNHIPLNQIFLYIRLAGHFETTGEVRLAQRYIKRLQALLEDKKISGLKLRDGIFRSS